MNGGSPLTDGATTDNKAMDEEDDLVAESDGPVTHFQTVGPQRLRTVIQNRSAEKWRRIGPCNLKVVGDCTQVVAAFFAIL